MRALFDFSKCSFSFCLANDESADMFSFVVLFFLWSLTSLLILLIGIRLIIISILLAVLKRFDCWLSINLFQQIISSAYGRLNFLVFGSAHHRTIG